MLYFRDGGSCELNLPGKQNRATIRHRLRPRFVGGRLPWWHRWPSPGISRVAPAWEPW